MINVKDEVFAALSQQFNNVSDQYPEDFLKLPAIQYIEEENKVLEHTFSEKRQKKTSHSLDTVLIYGMKKVHHLRL